MKFEENVLYKVTTREEDDWIRKQLHNAGFHWVSGYCVLDLTYFGHTYWRKDGAYYYEVNYDRKTCCGTTPQTESELGNKFKIVEIKNIYEKENFMENWMKYCVEAATPEEAYEKWKRGETIAKEQPDLSVVVKNNHVTIMKHGEVCEEYDVDDVSKLEDVIAEYLDEDEDEDEDEEHVLTEAELHILEYFEAMACDTICRAEDYVYGINGCESDDAVASVLTMNDEFDWLEEYENYDIEELRDLYK